MTTTKYIQGICEQVYIEAISVNGCLVLHINPAVNSKIMGKPISCITYNIIYYITQLRFALHINYTVY